VPQKSRISKTFSPYYQDSPLLIQFIISEFLLIHQIADPIKKLIQTNLQPSTNWEESIQIFYRLLTELLGNPFNYQNSPTSSWNEGPLTKMKNYCEHLSHHVPFLKKTHLNLQTSVYQAWISAIHSLELIKAFHLRTTLPKNFSLKKHFEHPLNKFLNRLSRMTKEIPRNTNLFWDNENVAYFLIRKKKELAKVFGENEFIRQFKSFGKQGILVPLLIKKFQARGFDYFDLKHMETHD
jgi:hypothetical protein